MLAGAEGMPPGGCTRRGMVVGIPVELADVEDPGAMTIPEPLVLVDVDTAVLPGWKIRLVGT